MIEAADNAAARPACGGAEGESMEAPFRSRGFAGSPKKVEAPTDRTCRLASATPERLQALIAANLAGRGRRIRLAGMTVSMHPGQFTVLSSPNPEVARAPVAELSYQSHFLDALGAGPEAKLIIHRGGACDDPQAAKQRFIRRTAACCWNARPPRRESAKPRPASDCHPRRDTISLPHRPILQPHFPRRLAQSLLRRQLPRTLWPQPASESGTKFARAGVAGAVARGRMRHRGDAAAQAEGQTRTGPQD